MLDKINMLREKLEYQILNNESYDRVLATSKEIDHLLMEYYHNKNKSKSDNLILIK